MMADAAAAGHLYSPPWPSGSLVPQLLATRRILIRLSFSDAVLIPDRPHSKLAVRARYTPEVPVPHPDSSTRIVICRPVINKPLSYRWVELIALLRVFGWPARLAGRRNVFVPLATKSLVRILATTLCFGPGRLVV